MHYGVLVVTNSFPTDELVAEVLAPYSDGKEWDWYQIGGRWTGTLDGYDPETDPTGTGKHVAWPTQWKAHKGDLAPIGILTEEHLTKFYAYCVEGYGWIGSERYMPWATDKFQKQEMPSLDWLRQNGKFVAVVDCHN